MTCASCPKSGVELNGVSPDSEGEQAPARPTLRGARGRVVFPGERLFIDLKDQRSGRSNPAELSGGASRSWRFLHDEWPHPSLVPKSPPAIRQKNHSFPGPRQAAESSPRPGQGVESYRQCLNLPKTAANQDKPAHSREMSPATGRPVLPMLATLGNPPTGERWAFESKWDGIGWVRRFSSAECGELAARSRRLIGRGGGFDVVLHQIRIFVQFILTVVGPNDKTTS